MPSETAGGERELLDSIEQAEPLYRAAQPTREARRKQAQESLDSLPPPNPRAHPDHTRAIEGKRKLRAEALARALAAPDGDPWAAQKAKLWAVLGIGPDGPDDDGDQGR